MIARTYLMTLISPTLQIKTKNTLKRINLRMEATLKLNSNQFQIIRRRNSPIMMMIMMKYLKIFVILISKTERAEIFYQSQKDKNKTKLI